jgi:hypothetical protein
MPATATTPKLGALSASTNGTTLNSASASMLQPIGSSMNDCGTSANSTTELVSVVTCAVINRPSTPSW